MKGSASLFFHPDLLILEARLLPSGAASLVPVTDHAPLSQTAIVPQAQDSSLVVSTIRVLAVVSKPTAGGRSPVTPSPNTLVPSPGFIGVSLQDEYNLNPNGQAFTPPNAMGAIGPNHFVEFINGRFAVYSRAGVLNTAASKSLQSFWSAASPTGTAVDTRIIFDTHSGRWIASSRDTGIGNTNNNLLFAVSQTNDPTQPWTLYSILAGTGRSFVDYDTLGVDDNGLYFGMTVHDVPTNKDSAAIFAFPKAQVLSGGAITVTKFVGITNMFLAPQAAVNLDPVAPTDPAWFVGSTTSFAGISYRTLTWNGTTPTLSPTTVLATPGFGGVVSAPSLGGTQNIATVDHRLLMAVIRNHQLWTARTVGVDQSGGATANPDRDAAEFLELDVHTTQASLIQSGRAFDPFSTNPRSYYFPSVMVNGLGYMVMGFSGSSATEYAGAFATGRLPSDPLGSLQPVTLLKAGEGAYTITFGSSLNRWGDYSYTSLDPTDDRTLWTIQEYAAATVPPGSGAGDTTSRWGTWITPLSSPKLLSATAMGVSQNPSAFGQPITFTAVVSAPGSPATPTGTVDFTEGATDLTPRGVAVTAGVATFSTSTLALGVHTITATYGGDNDFLTSSANNSAAPQTIRTTTMTAVSSSPNSSVFGQRVTFTATVSAGGAGTPTGLVDFTEGSTDLTPGGITLAGGVATFSTSALSVSTHTISAAYGGDGNFLSSTGSDAASPQVVGQASSQTAITSGSNPAVFGQKVTFSATVTAVAPGAGAPTGSVDFKEGATDLTPGGVALSGGVATFTSSTLGTGNHTITALYSGDTDFNSGQGDDSASPQVVNRAATTTAVKASVNPSVFGQPVIFTATVRVTAPGAGAPSGTVTFKDGTLALGTGALDAQDRATLSTAALSHASHAITAVYGGDASFNNSTSVAYGQTVQRDATTTTVSSAPNPSVFGQLIVVTATVTASAPGGGLPTGTVTFMEGGVILAAHLAQNSGLAKLVTKVLGVGSHTITAVYSGDGSFLSSSGDNSANLQVVNKDSSQTVVNVSANPAVAGQTVMITAQVFANAPGAGTPTGTVTFNDFGSSIGTAALNGGLATLTTASMAKGNHAITASYSGDGDFTASTSIIYGEAISKGPTASVVTSSANPSIQGQPLTFTALVHAVAPASGLPTGTVKFMEGTLNLGTTTLGAGQATFSTVTLTSGNHAITTIYVGDNSFSGNTSPVFGQTVNPGPAVASVSAARPSGAIAAGAAVRSSAHSSVPAPAFTNLSPALLDSYFASAPKLERAAVPTPVRRSARAAHDDWLWPPY